jgi:hypothetical protein
MKANRIHQNLSLTCANRLSRASNGSNDLRKFFARISAEAVQAHDLPQLSAGNLNERRDRLMAAPSGVQCPHLSPAWVKLNVVK